MVMLSLFSKIKLKDKVVRFVCNAILLSFLLLIFSSSYLLSGGAVPGNAEPCPGMVYCGRNWAKLTPNAPGNWPCWKPAGNWPAGVIWEDNGKNVSLLKCAVYNDNILTYFYYSEDQNNEQMQ